MYVMDFHSPERFQAIKRIVRVAWIFWKPSAFQTQKYSQTLADTFHDYNQTVIEKTYCIVENNLNSSYIFLGILKFYLRMQTNMKY